jgi:hypothetical protein
MDEKIRASIAVTQTAMEEVKALIGTQGAVFCDGQWTNPNLMPAVEDSNVTDDDTGLTFSVPAAQQAT